MRSLEKLIMLGRLILLIESLIAGLVFITIAITVVINPGMIQSVSGIGFISKLGNFIAVLLPRTNASLLITLSSILLGVFNLSFAWVAVYARIERRKI